MNATGALTRRWRGASDFMGRDRSEIESGGTGHARHELLTDEIFAKATKVRTLRSHLNIRKKIFPKMFQESEDDRFSAKGCPRNASERYSAV